MALTGAQLLTGLSSFINDDWSSTTTAAGASDGTTIEDDALERFGDDNLIGQYVRLTSGGSTLEVSRITDSAQSSGVVTVSPPFSAQVAGSVTYEIHKYDPAKKFKALDAARLELVNDIFKLEWNETLTSDGINRTYSIPSALRLGPLEVQVEAPISPDASWNFIQDPRGDSTTNWTATSATATTVDKQDYDKYIPKYDETCTKVAVATDTNGTYKQPVASMTNSITAALASGRVMTFGAWVYCKLASRVTITLEDDTDESASSTHGGAGWEFLTVTKDITHGNATTLTAGFDVTNASGAVDFWVNRSFLLFGDQVPEQYATKVPLSIRRDGTNQTFTVLQGLPRGRQLRLIGKTPLSALGVTAASQITNTMETDASQAELLYAKTAEILFGWDGLVADNAPEIFQRISIANSRRNELRSNWAFNQRGRMVRTPYDGI